MEIFNTHGKFLGPDLSSKKLISVKPLTKVFPVHFLSEFMSYKTTFLNACCINLIFQGFKSIKDGLKCDKSFVSFHLSVLPLVEYTIHLKQYIQYFLSAEWQAHGTNKNE